MISQEIKIPADGRPIEAFVMSEEPKPPQAFLVLPGQGYTINHFLLDFLWRMAAETGFYSVKAEYRGFTYRHLGEPYDHKHATNDAEYVLKHLDSLGYSTDKVTICGKSLGSIAVGSLVMERNISFQRTILLTPVLYINKTDGIFPTWKGYCQKAPNSCFIFGTNDEYCDIDSAKKTFQNGEILCYEGADHGLHLPGDYAGTIEMNRQIIERVKEFISK